MNEIMKNSSILYQPKNSDPQEKAIRKKLENSVLITDYSRKIVRQLHDVQENFFTDAFKDLDNNQKINKLYQELLLKLSNSTNSKIISGEHNLDDISSQQGVIIITNHLGLIKLTKIDNSNKKFPLALDNFEPFPLRHAPILPIAQKLGFNLHETAIELPHPLSKIQKACGILIVNPEGNNRTQKLINDTSQLLDTQKSAIVMYPEGGTSGKRNNAGPYKLDTFHSGSFVIGLKLNIPILPVCQFFNPDKGFELMILPAIMPNELKSSPLKDITIRTQNKMQKTLNSKLK